MTKCNMKGPDLRLQIIKYYFQLLRVELALIGRDILCFSLNIIG